MTIKKLLIATSISFLCAPTLAMAQADFNPNFIISDAELQNYSSWNTRDVQSFLDARGSYLRNYQTENSSGTIKSAAEIIFDAAQAFQINPKFLLVTLQKEQSLVTDDFPTQKQLDWATGYAVCDSCSMSDPKVVKHKGFGKQVEDAAGIMRWYYNNNDKSYIKKKDVLTLIDKTDVIPGSWATAFLYTYTPHLHGNSNFWRIWQTWFSQVYPDGTLLQSNTTSSTDVWLLQNNKKRRFANRTALITRLDPKLIISVSDTELTNYEVGPEITFPNYSILKSSAGQYYLLDYDTLRPFAGEEVVRQLGYNPQEIIDVNQSELINYSTGNTITASSTSITGVIYQIADMNNSYYLLKDNVLFYLIDKKIAQTNYRNLKIEQKKRADITKYTLSPIPLKFFDGTLVQASDSSVVYVIEKGLKRRLADRDTFNGLGYKTENIIKVDPNTMVRLADGEPLFLNANLLSSKNKYLGDSEAEVKNLAASKLPTYLIAEYPSGRIISGKDIDAIRPIASITKLMTAYEATNQNFKAGNSTIYTAKKYASEGNPLSLVDGEKIKNNDLLNSMLIVSANNTARMVAQSTGLTEKAFVESINNRLDEWGADNTSITDVTGLDSGNKSSARDLLKIFTKVLGEKDLKSILAKTEYKFKELTNKNKIATHTIKNTNKIIEIPKR
ncbi:MAG: serine hydrolase, partial [bacterium]|nr:serine hydrolase [bacterium]